MARTPIAAALSRIVSSVAGSTKGQDAARTGPDRRTVLKGAGALAAGLAAPVVTALPARAAPPGGGGAAPRIVVVGAGLAGLSAAYKLRNAGYRCSVVEASNRVGGRC